MSFSNHLRKLAQPVWDAQLTHPFVVALGKGTLPERKFRYYILQDARFLADLARVFAAGALRAPDSESALRFAKLAEETITVERSLHENYGKRWKLSPQAMLNEPMAPTNHAYTRHMLAIAQGGTATEIAVVALPCAWIYCVVGKYFLKHGPPFGQTPLPRLAVALCLSGIRGGAGMDARQDRCLGPYYRTRRKEANGTGLPDQLEI